MENKRIVSASDFKVHCLEYLENTKSESAQYIVTKRGKPIAMLTPIIEENTFSFGQMTGTGCITGDIMTPIDVEWSENAD